MDHTEPFLLRNLLRKNDGDLYRLKIAELHENVRRKSMTWQEEVLALEEIKQIYEKLYGWTKQGERTDLTLLSDNKVPNKKKYNQSKLAKDLKISQPKLSLDLQLAEAIKKYPEIRESKKKTEALKKLRGLALHF